ncbi:hypothetical protein RSAG8_03842, partial [Rhizoctonia solani AG-8 WAC10335]
MMQYKGSFGETRLHFTFLTSVATTTIETCRVARRATSTDCHKISRMAVEHCGSGWDYLGRGEHAAYVLSFTLQICTRTSCNTLASTRSFWPSLSCFFCLVSCLQLLYEKGLFCYRDFMHHLTIKSNIPQLLCLDLHNATLRRTHHPHDQATTPIFFLYLALGGVVGNQLVGSTASSKLSFDIFPVPCSGRGSR